MHLCEVRRFMRNFCVYVNDPIDIKIFKGHKKFNVHAVYYHKKGLMGVEYSFNCSATTLIGAKRHAEAILKKERKKYE